MKILIACERSGIIRTAFAQYGHDAWSADLFPSDIPGNHLVMDNDMHLKDTVYGGKWDLLVAHPECTALANSGVWFYRDKPDQVWQAACFFNMLWKAPVKKICVENPVQHKYARQHIEKYSQTVQPWQFGHSESKRTCFWLKGLPLLKPTQIIARPASGHYDNQTASGQNKYGPSADRSYIRAKTYFGIAAAMASQWGAADK